MRKLEIPLQFLAPPTWPDPAHPPALRYEIRQYAAQTGKRAQRILADRAIATPCIDLNNYRCTAVIDWVEIYLDTLGDHQARNIQRKIDKWLKAANSASTVYVWNRTLSIGLVGHEFEIRFQQPDPKELRTILGKVRDSYDPRMLSADQFRISAIEISIDFKLKPGIGTHQSERDLLRWQMTDVLRRHLRPAQALTELDRCFPRFFSKTGQTKGATFVVDTRTRNLPAGLASLSKQYDVESRTLSPLSLANHNCPFVDTTSYIGERHFDVALRSMDKTTDKRDPDKKTVQSLPHELQRSRVEVTLQGPRTRRGGHGAFNLTTVDDLYGFSFQSIRPPVFEFFLPSFATEKDALDVGTKISATEEKVFQLSGVYGLDRLHRAAESLNQARYLAGDIAQPPALLRKKGRLLSYVELNQKADRALRALSKKWKRAP